MSVVLCRNRFDEQEELVLGGGFGSVEGILTFGDAIKLMTAKLTSNLRLYVLEDTTCDIMSTAQGRSKQKGKKDNGGIGN
jgi:hypothetical protein